MSLSEHTDGAPTRRRLPWRGILLAAVLVAYLLVTLGVLFRSPILRLDTDLFRLDLRHQHPDWKPWVRWGVLFGQRGPATLAFLPVFGWVAWRRRTTAPLVQLVTSLVLLNVSVGVVKLATGRVGPRQTHNTHDIFVGGDIYPSGHVSNAVVLYGLLAMLALNHRRIVTVAAAVLSVAVGLGTVYLDTHWFSDVIGGWLAGAVVLLVLPTVSPRVQRWVDLLLARIRRRFAKPTQEAVPPDEPPRTTAVRPVRPVRIAHSRTASRGRGESEKATPVSSEV